MLGIALGVAALIVVLSVMNGFSKEVRDRMLSVIAHVQLFDANGGALPDWQATAARAGKHPGVTAVAPFVATQALLGRGESCARRCCAASTRPPRPGCRSSRRLCNRPCSASWCRAATRWCSAPNWRARSAPRPASVSRWWCPTPRGRAGAPRMLPLTVAATFEAGHYEYDSTMALMLIGDARALFGLAGPTGLQLHLADRDRAGEVGEALARELGPAIFVSDWTRTNRQWFESVQIQKRMLFLILALIVAVAAFNLVSMLVMTVTDKQSDIAILRTLGATPRSIMGIFMVQGAASGVIGTLAGLLLGLLIAFNVGSLVPAIERLLGTTLLPANVYLISHMPSDPRSGDIIPIVLISLLLSFVATLYPSWRASRVQPAQALRHE